MRRLRSNWKVWGRAGVLCLAGTVAACKQGPPPPAQAAEKESDSARLSETQTEPDEVRAKVLAGTPLAEACWEVVSDARFSKTVRAAALELLARETNPENRADGLPPHWRERWSSLANPDPWLEDMRWWVLLFGTLPRGRYECDAVGVLLESPHAALVQQALATHGVLKELPDYVPAPRFVPALALTDAATARMTRQELLTSLSQRLDARMHLRRVPSSPNGLDDNPETLAANQQRLSRGDLLTIRLLLDGLRSPVVIHALDEASRADRADKTTEYGGVLSMDRNGLHATLIPPLYAGNDMTYLTPDAAFRQAATGLALFHLHAQDSEDALAGPGVGDLKFAQAVHASCVVVTRVSAGRYDVDYYNPEMAVVDLGIYTVGD